MFLSKFHLLFHLLFLLHYFEKYLGIPENEAGPIFDFYDTYGKLPSEIKINNFDINIENIDMSSSWRDLKIGTINTNYTKSIIDMSNLKLNLDTEFNLVRTNPSVQDRLKELDGITVPIPIPLETESFDASSSRNRELIVEEILHDYPFFVDLAPDLTFSGKLAKDIFNEIHLNYKGSDTGVIIDVVLL